ncbi:hypothetical protein AOXY_G31934 [Acipenser oxyrinchus oxyrinchus]|uniref:EGF-like domain-containing protein n=1 Tax=Acipenser oxyrinchus oxyrinchus TaxID=40147 RepID=A0AAD8CIH0_ACIOX|nr:hypothetical protein AOXY_G31934 [Acipenser oxyrinchus oxyrinchus]
MSKDREQGAVELVKKLHTGSSVAQKIAAVKKFPGKALSMVLKSVNTMAKVLSAFSFIGSLISCILAFIPQEDPVMSFMKEQFSEVNRKLDSIAFQITSLQTDIKWSTYASVYSQDESKIENSWEKFNEFMKSALEAKTVQEKTRLAERFTTFFENTGTEGSVFNFYRYLTQKDFSLKENLLKLVNEKFKGDFKVLMQFSGHFTSLMLKGMQLNLYYYALKGYDGASKAQDATNKFTDVLAAVEEAMVECIDQYEGQVKEDVQEIGLQTFSTNSDLASKIQQHLQQKFDWYDWIVIVYDNDQKDQYVAGKYIDLNVQNKANVFIFHREKGVEINEEIKKQITNTGKSYCIDKTADKVYHTMTSVFNNEIMNNVIGFHGVFLPKHYTQTKDKGNVKIICQLESTYTIILKGKEEVENPPCSKSPCQNGICKPIPATTGEFCMCSKMFYGVNCEKKVSDDFDWEAIKSTIDSIVIQPVPDLTSIFFSIKDLKEYTKLLAQSIESRIEWTQIFVKYIDTISKLQFINTQHKLLEDGEITKPTFIYEISQQLSGTSFRYLASKYNDLMMGKGFGDESNILDAYRNTLLLGQPETTACSQLYVNKTDYFVKYMFALQRESHLTWLKYLMLSDESNKIKAEEQQFKKTMEEQWSLYNMNGCGPLEADLLSNRFCTKPYHSTDNQQIRIVCENNYLAFPHSVKCTQSRWSVLPACYTNPRNGLTVCKSDASGTTCTATCNGDWAFSDGKVSQPYHCTKEPCSAFTPPSCTRCTKNSACSHNEVCHNGECQDGCSPGVNPCGPKTDCSTSSHKQKCECQSGWFGEDPLHGCRYKYLQWEASTDIPYSM